MKYATAAGLGVLLVLTTALTLPTIKSPRKRLVAPTTHGATLLVTKTPSSAAVVVPPPTPPYISLPTFKLSPSIIQTNYYWTVLSTTNFLQWNFCNIGVTYTGTNPIYWVTNPLPRSYYKLKGEPQ